MGIHTGIYNWQRTFYTGTDVQPDKISLFVKQKKEDHLAIINKQPLANWLGYSVIVSSFSETARIVKAVKQIFSELSQMKFRNNDPHLHECWNAFKNLFRGMIGIIPIAGNLTLILFDACKNAYLISKIEKGLADQENIAGIAMDGKIVFTTSFENIKKILKTDRDQTKTNKYYLAIFNHLFDEALKKGEKEWPHLKIHEISLKVKKVLENNI